MGGMYAGICNEASAQLHDEKGFVVYVADDRCNGNHLLLGILVLHVVPATSHVCPDDLYRDHNEIIVIRREKVK